MSVNDEDPSVLPPIEVLTPKTQGRVYVYAVEAQITRSSKRKSGTVAQARPQTSVKRPKLNPPPKEHIELEQSDATDEPVVHASLAAAMSHANSVPSSHTVNAIRPQKSALRESRHSNHPTRPTAGPSQPFSIVIPLRKRKPRVDVPTNIPSTLSSSKKPLTPIHTATKSFSSGKPVLKSRHGRPPGVRVSDVASHEASIQARSCNISIAASSPPLSSLSSLDTTIPVRPPSPPPRPRPSLAPGPEIHDAVQPPSLPAALTPVQPSRSLPDPPPISLDTQDARHLLQENNRLLQNILESMQQRDRTRREMHEGLLETTKATQTDMKEIKTMLKSLLKPRSG